VFTAGINGGYMKRLLLFGIIILFSSCQKYPPTPIDIPSKSGKQQFIVKGSSLDWYYAPDQKGRKHKVYYRGAKLVTK